MADLRLHRGARRDYDEAYDWYLTQGTRVAHRYEAKIQGALDAIQRAPLSFPRFDDRHRFAITKRYRYTVYYRMEGRDIVVVAIAAPGREVEYWRNRV